MANPSLIDRVGIDEIERQLNRFETLEKTAKHFGVNPRTITRSIKDNPDFDFDLEPHTCWRRRPKPIEGEVVDFTATFEIPPVIDSEGQAQ